MSEPTYDELLLFVADLFRWDLDAMGRGRPERLSSTLRLELGELISRVPRALELRKPEPSRLSQDVHEHVLVRLEREGDLSEMEVDHEERAALRDHVLTGGVKTYSHRPNEGSSVLLYYTLA